MSRINEQDIDTLRERADIVDLISGYSQLKKSSGTTFKALCPFHTEKTPSFTLDTAKGLWYCHGCGEGGNVYHFIQKIENLPFPEAVEWLARREGFDLRYEEQRPGDIQMRGLKARLLEANGVAARFFADVLMNAPEADGARHYLDGRGFGKEVAERWQLGFAPGGNALCRHLQGKGFTQEEITKSDLGRISDRDGSLYDTFRSRIIFPTWSLQGDVVGFGARAMGDQQPKYLNTSETPVFSKSRVMYGLNRAKSPIARGAAIIVEGYTDVIALHEAGIGEAVATNGVALGETHFEQLKKFTDRAVLMFDADEAGKGASERGFGLHHKIGLEVLIAPLPPGRDPADVVTEDGQDAVRKVIDAAQPLMQFKLEQTIAKLPLDTPEARSRAVREVVEVLRWHPDPIARHQYSFFAARRIGVDAEAIQRAIGEDRTGLVDEIGESSNGERERRLPGHVKVEREALRSVLLRSEDAAEWAANASPTDFTSGARRELFEKAIAVVTTGGFAAGAEFAQTLGPDARSLFTELTVGFETPAPDAAGVGEVFTRLKIFALERDIKARRDVLQDVNPLVDPEKHDALFTELVTLEAERRDLLRREQGSN